jgi:hypothetical protein
MKTPRDILFNCHQSADAKLDQVRHEVVSKLVSPIAPRNSSLPVLVLLKLWQELIWPCRRTWAAFAAVWLLMLVVNVSLRDPGQTTLAKSSPSGGMMMALQQQERLLAELSEPHKTRVTTSPPKPTAPQPRSDRRDVSRRPVYA